MAKAVQRAQSPDQIDRMDSNDLAGREAAGDDVEGVAVVGVVEGGDEDQIVCDVKVGVAGGQALVVEEDR